MGRRDDAHAHRLYPIASDRPHLSGLEDAEKHGLDVQRKLTNLVEEERSAICALERAAPRLDRSGERSTPVPEELARDELARDRATVERHERPGYARTLVQRTGDEVFADP